jgi:hypothetical protein
VNKGALADSHAEDKLPRGRNRETAEKTLDDIPVMYETGVGAVEAI